MTDRRGSAIGWAAIDTLTCLILVIYTLIAPPTKSISIPTQGLYAITQSCPVNSQDDVDLYVQDPNGNVTYFGNLTAGLTHLEQDVIPGINTVEGNVKLNTGDNERVIIRGVVPGEYIVDEHLYASYDSGVTCHTSLWSIKDGFQEITTNTVRLVEQGSVETAFRFSLDANGKITNVNHLFRDIVDVGPAAG